MPKIIFNTSIALKKIKQRFVTKPLSLCSDFMSKASDIFEKKATSTLQNNTYLSDVIFEKIGTTFPKIKATYKGKPLATTKAELYKQLCYQKLGIDIIGSESRTIKYYKRVVSNIGTSNRLNIASTSKYLHEINTPENKNPELNAVSILFYKKGLSTISNLAAHPRNFTTKEISDIARHTKAENFKYLNVLLNANPNEVSNHSIQSYMKILPFKKRDEKGNIEIVNCLKDKLKNLEDEKIKDFVESRISNTNAELKAKLGIPSNYVIPKNGIGEPDKCEMLLDAYHCENNHYSMVKGETNEYYKALKSGVYKNLADEIASEIKMHPEQRTKIYANPLATTEAEHFTEAVRLEPLKEFIGLHSESEPDMANYLYEKYFLTKIPDCDYKNNYIKINKEFGTKVFVENDTSLVMVDEIHSELKNWADVGGEKAKFPSIFDFSRAKTDFVDEGAKITLGYYLRRNNSINVTKNNFLLPSGSRTFRHEMTHLNDSKFFEEGIINGVDSNEIIQTRKYASEFKNAGTNEFSINYAYSNKNEFIAVASEEDYTKYSDEFKDKLVKLGTPEWALKLKPLPPFLDGLEEILDSKFINKAKAEKMQPSGNIPILFPNGIIATGLSKNKINAIAYWMATESGCDLKKIDFANLTQSEMIQELSSISKNAKENDRRTIIQIKNFEKFTTPTEENATIIAKLKRYLSDCSSYYKCTVITETDDLSKIDSGIKADQRFSVRLNVDD